MPDDDLIRDLVHTSIDTEIEKNIVPRIYEIVQKEEEKRFRQFKWFAAFLGLIGLGTFGTLANYLIEKAVETQVEIHTGNISEAIEFSKFFTITLKLDLGKRFSTEDVDAIMTYLRKVATINRVRHSKQFLAALSQVADSFVSAGQSASIDEIFSIYEREVLSSPILVEALLHHYGQEIVGREQAPNQDFGYSVFEKLERVSSSSKVSGLALAYRTLYESKRSPTKKRQALSSLSSDLRTWKDAIEFVIFQR